jgi:hypothetical protein
MQLEHTRTHVSHTPHSEHMPDARMELDAWMELIAEHLQMVTDMIVFVSIDSLISFQFFLYPVELWN